MLHKVTHCAGPVSANTRPHQLRWGDVCILSPNNKRSIFMSFCGQEFLARSQLYTEHSLPAEMLQQWMLVAQLASFGTPALGQTQKGILKASPLYLPMQTLMVVRICVRHFFCCYTVKQSKIGHKNSYFYLLIMDTTLH